MSKSPAIPTDAKRIMAQLLKLPPKPQSELKIGKKASPKAKKVAKKKA